MDPVSDLVNLNEEIRTSTNILRFFPQSPSPRLLHLVTRSLKRDISGFSIFPDNESLRRTGLHIARQNPVLPPCIWDLPSPYYVPSIRSHRETSVVFPDFQQIKVSEEPVCIHLFQQNLVFTSLHLRSSIHVEPPLVNCLSLTFEDFFPQIRRWLWTCSWPAAGGKWPSCGAQLQLLLPPPLSCQTKCGNSSRAWGWTEVG